MKRVVTVVLACVMGLFSVGLVACGGSGGANESGSSESAGSSVDASSSSADATSTSSTSDKAPNLADLTKSEPAQVAETLGGMTEVSLDGETFYTANEDMKNLLEKTTEAFEEDSKSAVGKLAEDVETTSPWAVSVFEGKKGVEVTNWTSLEQKDAADGNNPGCASYVSYHVLDNPTSESLTKIVQEVTTLGSFTMGGDKTSKGASHYQENIEFIGYGESDDVATVVAVAKLGDVYRIEVEVYNTSEMIDDYTMGGSSLKGHSEDFYKNADDYFDDVYKLGK